MSQVVYLHSGYSTNDESFDDLGHSDYADTESVASTASTKDSAQSDQVLHVQLDEIEEEEEDYYPENNEDLMLKQDPKAIRQPPVSLIRKSLFPKGPCMISFLHEDQQGKALDINFLI